MLLKSGTSKNLIIYMNSAVVVPYREVLGTRFYCVRLRKP